MKQLARCKLTDLGCSNISNICLTQKLMWFHVILRNTKGSPAFRSKVSTLNYPGCTTCCETDSLNDPIQKSRSTFFGDSPALHLLVRPFSSHSRNTQLPPVAHAPSTAAVASRPVALMLRCHNNRPPSSAACAAWTWEAGERHILSYIYILYIYIYIHQNPPTGHR